MNICREKYRLLKSVFLAMFIFLALSYDFHFLTDPDSMTTYELVRARLSTYGFKGNLYVAGLTTLFWLWFQHFGDKALFSSRPLTITACLFGLLNQSALHLFYRNLLRWLSVRAIGVFLIQAAAWAILFLIVSRAILALLEDIGEKVGTEKKQLSGFPAFLDNHIFLSAFLVILLGWLPWVISYYPASIEWDVYDPILRWLGVRNPSNHHPWFFTMIVGSAWKLGDSLGDKNFGVFLYIIIRDLCLAAVYARCIYLEKKNGLPRPVYIVVILFFSFTPVWGAYAKHAFKDTIAAALFCWFVHLLVVIIGQVRSLRLKPAVCLEYSAVVLLGCLFRNNTVYVVIPITIMLMIYCLIRKQGWKTALLLVLGVLLFRVYEGYIFEYLHVEKGSAREALSLPFQQTGRTVKFHKGKLTEEEKAVICFYWEDENVLAAGYDPIISDPIKGQEKVNSPNLGDYKEYLKLWWKMGFKYPYTYLEAMIAHTSGYYTFTPEYTEEQRYGPGSHNNVGMSIFNWAYDDRFPDWLNCSYPEWTEDLRNILDEWAELWHQIPILNLTDMKPIYTWTICLIGGLLIKRKEYDKILPIAACVLMILTCIASPVNDCFRYYAPVAASFPGLFILLSPESGKGLKETCQ